MHRTGRCSAHEEEWKECAPATPVDIAAASGTSGAQAFERGIFLAIDSSIPSPTREAAFVCVFRPLNSMYKERIYTDGSRIDGTDPRKGRNGWAFVVLNHTGRIIAKACGVAPDWVDDIPGAGAWALLQAATGAEPGCTVFCACQPCVRAVHAGVAWATSDRRKHARVHNVAKAAWGDSGPDSLILMTAHCTDDEVGSLHRGDGVAITKDGIKGNGEADRLAKMAADMHRVPEGTRIRLNQQKNLIQNTVKWIGRAAYLANNHETAPTRDVDTFRAATACAKKQRAAARSSKSKLSKRKVAVRLAAVG